MRAFSGKTVWLIGASAGIGEQLALLLAAHGARVILSARNQKKLELLRPRLEGEGHFVAPLDATRDKSIDSAWRSLVQKRLVPDIVIYNAGAYEPQPITDFKLERAMKVVQVNFLGAMKVLSFVIPAFIKRKSGHIVLVGSVAGYRGLPNSVAYGASKAALIHLAECLKTDLAPYDIKVQLVSPGFVKTRLTEKNDFKMPAMITAQDAAHAILKGLRGNRFDIHFPKRFTLVLKVLRILPYCLYFRLVRNLDKPKEKPAAD